MLDGAGLPDSQLPSPGAATALRATMVSYKALLLHVIPSSSPLPLSLIILISSRPAQPPSCPPSTRPALPGCSTRDTGDPSRVSMTPTGPEQGGVLWTKLCSENL